MSFEDFIDEEDVEFVNELENPKKYHVFKEDAMCYSDIWDEYYPLLNKEVVDRLDEQEETIQNQKEYILLLEQKLEENGIRLEPKDYN